MQDMLTLLVAAQPIAEGAGRTLALIDVCLYLPLGVLLSVAVIEIFSGGRRGVDLDRAVVLLLVLGSVLFFIGGFLTFSQSSVLGRQTAVEAAGLAVLLGIASAIAAVLKQQCYLQKLMQLARGRSRGRKARPVLLWPTCYFIVLLGMMAGVVAFTWSRPGWHSTTPMSGTGGSASRVDLAAKPENEVSQPDGKSPGLASASDGNQEPETVPEESVAAPVVNDDAVAMGVEDTTSTAGDPWEEPVELDEPVEPEGAVASIEDTVESSPDNTPSVKPQEPALETISAKIDPAALHIFKGSIVPLLRDRCVSCHGEEKQKGKLRLDSPEWIRRGGNSGPVVEAFQPRRSLLYTSTTLPADDPDIMPAEGKPLTSAQTSAIGRWINGGAPMGDGMDREAAAAAVAAMQQQGKSAVTEENFSAGVAEALKAAHIQFKQVDDGLFEIDCSLTRNYPERELDLEILRPIASKIHTLDLSKTKVGDADLAPVASMTNLRRLLLSRTTLGDDALAHISGLTKLEVINLYGTNVSDAGLEHLAGLSNLKKLYLWNSKATSAGAERLARALPDVDVNVGQ